MHRLLDISRLLRRAGRPMTGVDRVEFAYLQELCTGSQPFHAFARTRFGYVLLDKTGAQTFMHALVARDFAPLDTLGRIPGGGAKIERRAEASLRKLAIARTLPQRLPSMLKRHLPDGIRYINTGHSNLTDRVLSALRSVNAHISVLIHDVIPLEAPHYQRAGSVEKFERFLKRADRWADLLIYNSRDTQRRTEAFLTRKSSSVVAHLGVALADEEPLPEGCIPEGPYFVILGTIEPRKNHALLLDVWEAWGADAPTLVIAGSRGWNNQEVFARLDAHPLNVIEQKGLSDGQIATLLKGANGLLFPSHLEGFGLPAVEAAMLGCPVVCQPLEVFRETLGDIPIYLDGSDAYLWRNTLETLAEQRAPTTQFEPPTWAEHFNIVLRLT